MISIIVHYCIVHYGREDIDVYKSDSHPSMLEI